MNLTGVEVLNIIIMVMILNISWVAREARNFV